MDSDDRVTALADVPDDTTFLFTVRESDTGDEREAVLARIDGEIAGWLNYCQHLIDVKLDKGTGAEMRDGEIVCTNHGATFEADTGYCTFGPCEGAYLEGIEVAVDDGAVFLTDDHYDFVEAGPVEDDGDLTSTSNIEF